MDGEANTMRAKISSRDGGFDALRPDLYEADRKYIETVSCDEALALLAETEPEPSGCWSGLPSDLRVGFCQSPMWDALAESIAAFVQS